MPIHSATNSIRRMQTHNGTRKYKHFGGFK